MKFSWIPLLRRTYGYRWHDYMSNDLVLSVAGLRQVTCTFRERQLRLYGHVARLPAEDPAHWILSCREIRGVGPFRGDVHTLHDCVRWSHMYRNRSWKAWCLPGRWPDGCRYQQRNHHELFLRPILCYNWQELLSCVRRRCFTRVPRFMIASGGVLSKGYGHGGPVWVMARRRPKVYRRQVDAATRCSGVCPHTWTGNLHAYPYNTLYRYFAPCLGEHVCRHPGCVTAMLTVITPRTNWNAVSANNNNINTDTGFQSHPFIEYRFTNRKLQWSWNRL